MSTVSWSADGKTLATIIGQIRGDSSQWVLSAISRKTGEVHDLYSFPLPAQAAAWLPDGSGLLVLSADLQSARGQIRFVSYPQGEVSRFTNDLTNYNLCCLEVTRDGDSLVALQNTTLSDVWTAKPDGSDAKQITGGEAVGFGLDWVGSRIVAQNTRGQWFLMNPDGSNRLPLTDDRDPHFQLSACNDGQHVLYTTWRNGIIELWRSQADGSNPIKLPARAILGGALCAPDSKSSLYVADGAVWRVSIEGGTPEKTDLPFSEFGYSPDGTLLFYTSQTLHEGGNVQSKLLVKPASGGSPLYSFGIPYGMQSPRFTPDGKAIAFLLTRNHAANIWEQPLAGGDLVQLTKFPSGEMFAFAWSRDGKQLAFSRGQRSTDVVMMSNFR
jgi:Tol biopolymer transport system component